MTIVVFGGRGSVGRNVVAGLKALDVPVRGTGRAADGELTYADFDKPETLAPALDGAESVFVYAMRSGVDDFVGAAKEAGVRHVVLLSSGAVVMPGLADNPIAIWHKAVEDALEASGIGTTFLRGGFFATNTRWYWQAPIRQEQPVRLAYPQAQMAPVHEKDLADLAVAALVNPASVPPAPHVVGPESITLRRMVESIASATGRPVAIEEAPPDEVREEMRKHMPEAAVDGMLARWAASAGRPAETTTVVADVLGKPGRTFGVWATDHADDFR
jgi:uncharacterized protein YbjT (DUF2867 family)